MSKAINYSRLPAQVRRQLLEQLQKRGLEVQELALRIVRFATTLGSSPGVDYTNIVRRILEWFGLGLEEVVVLPDGSVQGKLVQLDLGRFDVVA